MAIATIDTADLNKKISIVTITSDTNENGFEVPDQTVFRSCFAKVVNMSGTLIFKGEVYQKGISQFTVRYRHDKEILPSMKIRYKSDLYDIIDVDNVNEANEFIKLMGQVITNGS